jgi:hypothetical protein
MAIQIEAVSVNEPGRLERFVTIRRHQILQLLAQYRFLTTIQIHSLLQPERDIKRTWEELDRLRKLGMVKGVSIEPEKGIYGQFCWLLLLRGAKEIGFREYSSYNRRKPGPQSIYLRTMELILEKQIEHTCSNSDVGWQLEKPQRTKNHPEEAEKSQVLYQRIAEAINWKIFVQTGRKPEEKNGFQTLCIPSKINDFVAYTMPNGHLAVVLILPPQRVSEKFWMSRIAQYQDLAKELPVIGVFEDEKQALAHKPLVNPYRFRVTTINRVSTLLEAIARSFRPE